MARRCDKEGLRAYHREYMARRRARPGHVEPGPADPVAQREKDRLRSASYRLANPEKVRVARARWWKGHPERARIYFLRRRALKNGASGTCTAGQLQARIDFYGGRCWMCGAPYEAIDHVIPLSKGGTNWPANLRPACTSCNSKKKDRDWRLVCPSR